VPRVDQVIFAIDVFDVDVVVIVPVGRPGFLIGKVVATVAKTPIVAAGHMEVMLGAEVFVELRFWDATAMTATAGAIVVAIHLDTLRHPISTRSWVMTFGGYTVWSFVQQFLLQGYFLFRFLRLLPRREWAALAAAGIFAAAHLPNPILTPVTFIWGLCACFVFLRFRNVYPLAIAHALLGITVAITIPGPVVRNMRVGLGYLRYHAPHAHPPGLEPTPTSR